MISYVIQAIGESKSLQHHIVHPQRVCKWHAPEHNRKDTVWNAAFWHWAVQQPWTKWGNQG